MTILRRQFESYDAYVEAQGRKARYQRQMLLDGFGRSVGSFTKIFSDAKPHLNAGAVLCLGARTGAEAVAAELCGFQGSRGVDLHPVGAHVGRYVQRGDWHAMPEFLDASFPNVYCNSFDHCLDLQAAVSEVRRILLRGGAFYLMASDKGQKDSRRERSWLLEPKHCEALYWSHSDELRDAVLAFGGFAVRAEWRSGQWGHYVLAKDKRP